MDFSLNSKNDAVYINSFFLRSIHSAHCHVTFIQYVNTNKIFFWCESNDALCWLSFCLFFVSISSDITCFHLWIHFIIIIIFSSHHLVYNLNQFVLRPTIYLYQIAFAFATYINIYLLCVCLWYSNANVKMNLLYVCLKLSVLFTALNCWFWSSFSRIMIRCECIRIVNMYFYFDAFAIYLTQYPLHRQMNKMECAAHIVWASEKPKKYMYIYSTNSQDEFWMLNDKRTSCKYNLFVLSFVAQFLRYKHCIIGNSLP